MPENLEARILATEAQIFMAQYEQSQREAESLEALAQSFICQVKALEDAGQSGSQILSLETQQVTAAKNARAVRQRAQGLLKQAEEANQQAWDLLTTTDTTGNLQ